MSKVSKGSPTSRTGVQDFAASELFDRTFQEGMELVEAAFAERSVLPAHDIRVTAFGNRVQEAGAGIVSLGGLYSDPIGALRRSQNRRPEVSA